MTIVHNAKPRRGRPPRAEASAKALAGSIGRGSTPSRCCAGSPPTLQPRRRARVAACRALIAAEAAPGDGDAAPTDAITVRALQIMSKGIN